MTLIKSRRSNGTSIPSIRSNLLDLFETNPIVQGHVLDRPFSFLDGISNNIPACNVCEKDEDIILEVAAPGMEKGDFKIDIKDEMLEIRAEKEIKEENEIEDQYTRREYDYRSFHRAFSLPKSVNTDNVSAEYKNGILRVHLPKKTAKETPTKEISIE